MEERVNQQKDSERSGFAIGWGQNAARQVNKDQTEGSLLSR
jgi:hypothetical protein